VVTMVILYSHMVTRASGRARPPELKVRTISAARFKAQCLALMDEVDRTGEEIVVTKRNRPVAKLAALGGGSSGRRAFVGRSQGMMEIRGDITEAGEKVKQW